MSACVYWRFHVRVTSGPRKYDVWLLLLKQRQEMDIKWQAAMNQKKYQLFNDKVCIVNNANISYFDFWTSHVFGKGSIQTNMELHFVLIFIFASHEICLYRAFTLTD